MAYMHTAYMNRAGIYVGQPTVQLSIQSMDIECLYMCRYMKEGKGSFSCVAALSDDSAGEYNCA